MLRCMRNLKQSSNCSLLTINWRKKTEREISLLMTTKNKNNLSKKLKIKKLTTHFCTTRCWVYVTRILYRKFTIVTRIIIKMTCILICKGSLMSIKILLMLIYIKGPSHSHRHQKGYCLATPRISKIFHHLHQGLMF
jgi:hypothetical protein